MFTNLIMSGTLLLFVCLFVQDLLDRIYPGIFGKIVRLVIKLVATALKLALWPFGFAMSKLLEAVLKKELPGRQK